MTPSSSIPVTPAPQPITAAKAMSADEVVQDEHDAINRSLGAHGGQHEGLAFSGGGIRSATFCLGIIQGMAAHRKLSRFD